MNELVNRRGKAICLCYHAVALVSSMRHVSLAWKCAMVTLCCVL